jgi:hypothetical protein
MRAIVHTYEIRCHACGKKDRFEFAGPMPRHGPEGLPPGWSHEHDGTMHLEGTDYPVTDPRHIAPIKPGRLMQDLCPVCTAKVDNPAVVGAEENR